ncbi:hypothetical protein Ndes2437B_g05859 [Nannochloris sp. 'desiccata']|nr:hypothetical protein KSW81_007822 [Chlorella desiccata (nom. nud.)]
MSSKEFKALEQKGIKIGDTVRTQFRGGERKGVVKSIAMTKEETAHPPKVIFDTEKDGKEVAHNPSTLEKVNQ